VRICRYEIYVKTITPLHVGQEMGTKLSIIDHRVYRRVKYESGGRVEEVSIPASTIKGVFRHVFEDFLRSLVIDRLCLDNILEIVGRVIAAVVDVCYVLNDRALRDQFERMLATTQNIVQPSFILREDESLDLVDTGELARRVYSYVISNVSSDARSFVGEENIERLCKLSILCLQELLPLVCEPVGNFCCVPDTALLEFGSDRGQTVRFIVNTVLLRKTPLRVEVCPSCILFGATGLASRLRFKDLTLDEGSKVVEPVLPIVTRVAIDRFTKAAKKGKLFTLEYVPPGVMFKGEIYFTPLLKIDYELAGSGMLEKILKAIAYEISGKVPIGKQGSVGYGLVKIGIGERPRDSNDDPSLMDVIREYIVEFYLKEAALLELCKSSRMNIRDYVDHVVNTVARLGLSGSEVNKVRNAIEIVIDHRLAVEKIIANIL